MSRTLLVVLVVLAFARPSLRGTLGALGERRAAIVLLVDSSYSMACRIGRRTRHARARDLARDLVDGLAEGDEVSVIACGARARVAVTRSTDRAVVKRAIAINTSGAIVVKPGGRGSSLILTPSSCVYVSPPSMASTWPVM